MHDGAQAQEPPAEPQPAHHQHQHSRGHTTLATFVQGEVLRGGFHASADGAGSSSSGGASASAVRQGSPGTTTPPAFEARGSRREPSSSSTGGLTPGSGQASQGQLPLVSSTALVLLASEPRTQQAASGSVSFLRQGSSRTLLHSISISTGPGAPTLSMLEQASGSGGGTNSPTPSGTAPNSPHKSTLPSVLAGAVTRARSLLGGARPASAGQVTLPLPASSSETAPAHQDEQRVPQGGTASAPAASAHVSAHAPPLTLLDGPAPGTIASAAGQQQAALAQLPLALQAPQSQQGFQGPPAVRPSPAILDQVERLLAGAGEWTWNSFDLDEATQGHPLSCLSFYLFHSSGLIDDFALDRTKLARCAHALTDFFSVRMLLPRGLVHMLREGVPSVGLACECATASGK